MRAIALLGCVAATLVLVLPARAFPPGPPQHVRRTCGFFRFTFPAWRAGYHLCSVKPLPPR